MHEIENIITLSEDDKKLIRDELLLEGLAKIDIERFIRVCERSGLDPMTRQIYARAQSLKVKKGGQDVWVKKLVIITSIDGFRAIAARSGKYVGQTHPEWLWMDKNAETEAKWKDNFIPQIDKFGNAATFPDAARVAVHHADFKEPCFGYANFYSFVQWKDGDGSRKPTKFWGKMPELMIIKAAEAQAFRKAFPLVFGGIYIEEEISRNEEDESQEIPETKDELPEGMTAVESKPLPPAQPEEKKKVTRAKVEKPVEKPAEKPAPEPEEELPGAEEYVEAEQFEMGLDWKARKLEGLPPKYNGRLLGEMKAEEIDFLRVAWVERHKDRIELDEAKKAQAADILAGYEFHKNKK